MSFHRLPDEGPLPPAMIYEPAMRLWHWTNALCVLVLMVSGYLIGTPLASTNGDTSVLYSMGWLRFAHLACGQVMAMLFLGRVYGFFAGNEYARQLFLPEIWRREWTDGLLTLIAWNLFLLKRPIRYIGLNPLANLAMLALFVVPTVVTILTGFAMLAEVKGHESWQYAVFGWMVSIFGNTLDLHIIHRLGMWVLVCFVMMHIYTAVREDIVSRQTMVSTMLSGERVYRR
ncbi:MAG: Ni/Fe-hydrogenase, b-type cytochrome subunit [Magnetospirillum sp.]|nr:Ni/Fe-hydrogenase, b-type cytochrome subunit [Magnetospirillum sp.]